MQRVVILKKILPTTFIVFASAFALKSTDFKQNHTNNKLIVTMNPVYSEGDPIPAVAYGVPLVAHNNNTYQAKINGDTNVPQKIQHIATNQPTSIIPHYVPTQKTFYRPYVETVNSYLKKQDTVANQPTLAFQGKIPQNANGIKQLRPIQKAPALAYKKSYTIPIYKEYVSIQR